MAVVTVAKQVFVALVAITIPTLILPDSINESVISPLQKNSSAVPQTTENPTFTNSRQNVSRTRSKNSTHLPRLSENSTVVLQDKQNVTRGKSRNVSDLSRSVKNSSLIQENQNITQETSTTQPDIPPPALEVNPSVIHKKQNITLITSKATWVKALESCIKFGGELADIRDIGEKNALVELAAKVYPKWQRLIWLGASATGKSGIFVWSSSGTKIKTDIWSPEEVEIEGNRNCSFNCGALSWQPSRNSTGLVTYDCYTSRYFMCKFSTKK